MFNRSIKTQLTVKLLNSTNFFSSFMSFSSSPPPTITHINPQGASLLSRLDSCKSTQELKQLHTHIIKTIPSPQTQLIYPKIISISATSTDTDPSYVTATFTQISNPTVNSYNAVIRSFSFCKNRADSLNALIFFGELLSQGLFPDNYTYPFLLKACVQSRGLREGREVHGHVIKNGFLSDLYVLNTLMRLYAVCGVIEDAHKLFDGSPDRDLVSWTTLIQGYVKLGFWREGIRVFFEMCEANFLADEMTVVVALSACANLGDLDLGMKIHEYMRYNKLNFDVFVGNALVDMYLKCGDADSARKIFDEMPVKNVVSWNSMISGLAHQGAFKEALHMFRKMQKRGFKPDDFTLVAVLNSCANLGMLEFGKWVHAYVDRNHILPDGFIGNALIDMYAKCGYIDEAIKIFNAMRYRDVYSYTAIIVGLAMNGQGEKALDIFSTMPIAPDGVTYVGVLAACSHAGLVKEGRQHFTEMSRLHGLEPETEHYGCMVDLLGRAGLIDEAEEFIRRMPIKPDAFVWGALLGACRIHGIVELAETAMERLLELEPERDGAYVIMSNIYTSANKWREASKLRRTMRERHVKKTPGCSTIEVDGMVHEFQKGDKSHVTKEVHSLLHQMSVQVKRTEYWPLLDDFPLWDR